MKTPPFLLLAALLFWGWQSGFLIVGAIMGVILEGARFLDWRWELEDSDFNRIWSFCVLLNVALAGYVFTTNDAGGGWAEMIHGNTVRNLTDSGVETSTRFLRWLPMTMFAFVLAQVFNLRPSVPLTAVSVVLGWKRRKGDQSHAGHYVNIVFPYFIVCLFSAGIHANTGTQTYFWGQAGLIAWALWSLRSRRFRVFVWLAALVAVIALGFLGQYGINQAGRVIQNFNSQLITWFLKHRTDPLQSMTSMGRIGNLKLSPRIVVWLEPKDPGFAPGYLREASYRNYQSQKMTWFAGGTLNDFDLIQPESDNTSWVLVPGKKSTTSVNITCYLKGRSKDGFPEGVLPLPSGCDRLENLPAISAVVALQKNQNGTVMATGNGLMIFDAAYGPGMTLDAPPDLESTNRLDLAVPANEVPALDQVIAEMNLTNASYARKLQAVDRFFLNKFTYSTWQGLDKRATTNATPLTRFLLTSRSGHCEYFATATVLLLRKLGIPARYAVGFAVHETRGSGYIVRERDAHAWCLVWNGKYWEDFDTTPSSWMAVENRHTGFRDRLSDIKSWLGLQFAKLRWRQAHLQQYIFAALIPVMLVLLYHIIFRRRGKRVRKKSEDKNAQAVTWPGLDSEFYQLEKKLAARGVPRQTGESLSDWLERALTEPALAGLRTPLQVVLHLHYRHRFDPQGLSTEEREALRRDAKICLDSLLQTNK